MEQSTYVLNALYKLCVVLIYIFNTNGLCLTLEPCLASTSHSPLVNVTSSLIAHLKSPA